MIRILEYTFLHYLQSPDLGKTGTILMPMSSHKQLAFYKQKLSIYKPVTWEEVK